MIISCELTIKPNRFVSLDTAISDRSLGAISSHFSTLLGVKRSSDYIYLEILLYGFD